MTEAWRHPKGHLTRARAEPAPGPWQVQERPTGGHVPPSLLRSSPYLAHVQLEEAPLPLCVLGHLPVASPRRSGPVPLLLQPGPGPQGKRGLNISRPLSRSAIPTPSSLPRAQESEGALLRTSCVGGLGYAVNKADSGNPLVRGGERHESDHSRESGGRVKWGTRPFPAAQELMFELGSEV